MSYKVAVTKPGFNVLTETDPNNFIFDSSYNTFKIIATGTTSQSVAGPASGTITIAHGLSYTPLAYCFMKADTNDEATSPTFMFLQTGKYANVGIDDISADSTNIYIRYKQYDSSTITLKIRYYLFEVPL